MLKNFSISDKTNKLVKNICVFLVCMGAPYIGLFIYFGLTKSALVMLGLYVLCIAAYLANHFKHSTLSKFVLITGISLLLFSYSVLLGDGTGAPLIFFPIISMALVFFNRKEKKLILFASLIPIFFRYLFDFLEIYHSASLVALREYISPVAQHVIYEFAVLTAFLFTFYFVYFFHKSSYLFEEKLVEQNNTLQEANEALVEKAKTDKDIRAAQIVQRSTIPQKFPQPDGVIITHWYQAARGVGGDFIDGIALDEHRTLIICGDIVGKGIQASLKMAAFYPMFRMLVEGFTDVQDLVLRCSRAVEKFYEFTQYIPCTIALIDSKEQTLTFCNAGHEGGYLLRGDQVIELLTGGPPFGADIDPVYEVETISLQAGDRLVIFTDGFPDLKNPEGSRLKHQDALKIIKAVHQEVQNAESPEFFVDRVSQEFMVYKDNAPQADDMAIVSIEIGQRKEVQTA